jgi:hypothetical protein
MTLYPILANTDQPAEPYLEGLDLAAEDVVHAQLSAEQVRCGGSDLVHREERRLGAGAHGCDAQRTAEQ